MKLDETSSTATTRALSDVDGASPTGSATAPAVEPPVPAEPSVPTEPPAAESVTARAGELSRLLDELGITVEPDLLHLAFVHRSWAYEHGRIPTNERLEFLGDAVLGVVVTEHLFTTHPDLSEGQLAKLRAAVVNSRALAGVARSLGLGEAVLLGKGEEITGGRSKVSILGDTTEALIGAIHLSCGMAAAARFVHRVFDPLMERAATVGAGLDWKTSLQERASLRGLAVPHYTVTSEGPDHQKVFSAEVHIGTASYGPGVGSNKKEAEQRAAQTAFDALTRDDPDTTTGQESPATAG